MFFIYRSWLMHQFFCIVFLTDAQNASDDKVYIEPANKHFVEVHVDRADNGIAFETPYGRRVTFRHEDFFKIFPRIILRDNPKHYDVIRYAAIFNKNNQNRKSFRPIEIWWSIYASELDINGNINNGLAAISRANSFYPGTVSTVYMIVQRVHENITLDIVNNYTTLLRQRIDSSGPGNLSITLEIKDADLRCTELLKLPVENYSLIAVWLYGRYKRDKDTGHMQVSMDQVRECQRQLARATNNTKFTVLGTGESMYIMRHRNKSLKIWCEKGNVHQINYPCEPLKQATKFANDVNSYGIYYLDVYDAGIFEHPNRVFCGLRNNSLELWSRSPLRLNKKTGFSVYFDDTAINYTTTVLTELIKTSPSLLVENKHPLTNISEIQLNDFLHSYASMLNDFYKRYYYAYDKQDLISRTVTIKIDFKPINTRDQQFITEGVANVIEAAAKANQLSPELVESVVFYFEKEVDQVAYILKAINEIKSSAGWKSGIKIGVSFSWKVECSQWLSNSRGVDLILFEDSIKLSWQCLSRNEPKLFEESQHLSFHQSQFLICRNSKEYANKITNLELSFHIRIVWCRPAWQDSKETDVQYGLAIERLSTISGLYGNKLYIGSAFHDKNPFGYCGWWDITENLTADGETIIKDRKSSVKASILSKSQEDESDNQSSNQVELLWLWILLAISALCMIVVSIMVGVIILHRRKYLLRYEEVRAFFKGDISIAGDNVVAGSADALASKYDKQTFEIPANYYTIDTTKCLGTGEFGAVFEGTVTQNAKTFTVAVKTTKRRSKIPHHEDLVGLRGLISEIKILSYVGQHRNIVRLVGAHTEKLKRGHVAVFLEYCVNGSLFKHLRNCKQQLLEQDAYVNDDEQKLDVALQKNLMRWSYEIVAGMEFLTRKKIVHADLATRNVLLDSNHIAKISDFGLSRRLYNYTNYVKSHQEPLPWRWMAPEALQKLEFDEKTDVWAFGVTLWEIFTLGNVPYPGLSWSTNFANQLTSGLRLAEPMYNQNEMFTLMLLCWSTSAERRPTFQQIRGMLQSKIDSDVDWYEHTAYSDLTELGTVEKTPRYTQLE